MSDQHLVAGDAWISLMQSKPLEVMKLEEERDGVAGIGGQKCW